MRHNVRDCVESPVHQCELQSERDFSSDGRTVTDMLSRLNEETVEAVELLRWEMRAGFIMK